MGAVILTSEQRAVRMNIRNFFLAATDAELRTAIARALADGDRFRAECLRELLETS